MYPTPKIEQVLDFLSHLFDSGLSYSALNSARSALSTFIIVDGKPVGSHPLVVRLLKGVFNTRPSLPKNTVTWDPQILLDYLRTLSPVRNLNLLDLSVKTVSLLLILTGQRGQSLHLMDVRNITITQNHVKIRFGDLLKTTRPGFHQQELTLKAYAPDRRICIVTVLNEYMRRTADIRSVDALFISSRKPYGRVSRDTISRWFKNSMKKAGLDLSVFTPHSVRAASTSAAARANIPLGSILGTAGWARENTFRNYYDKPVATHNGFENVLE